MRLVILSNRLPFTVSLKNGHPVFESSSGGLSTGLWSFLERAAKKTEPLEFLWVGWPGTSVEPSQVQEIQAGGEAYHAASVFLSEETVEKFYHGFCNKTLWPLFHYVPSLVRYEEEYWQEYQRANQHYAEALLKILRPGDILWVHDYQLMLVPRMIRRHFPEMPIGFFLHIPFPAYEVFRFLPRAWRVELIEEFSAPVLLVFTPTIIRAIF